MKEHAKVTEARRKVRELLTAQADIEKDLEYARNALDEAVLWANIPEDRQNFPAGFTFQWKDNGSWELRLDGSSYTWSYDDGDDFHVMALAQAWLVHDLAKAYAVHVGPTVKEDQE